MNGFSSPRMKLVISNGKILKVNHPTLPSPVVSQPLPAPKLLTEKKVKKP
jgi:hypothetical protein